MHAARPGLGEDPAGRLTVELLHHERAGDVERAPRVDDRRVELLGPDRVARARGMDERALRVGRDENDARAGRALRGRGSHPRDRSRACRAGRAGSRRTDLRRPSRRPPHGGPSRASPLAVLSAQPPPCSVISSTTESFPRSGGASTGRATASATRMPRQTTSGRRVTEVLSAGPGERRGRRPPFVLQPNHGV